MSMSMYPRTIMVAEDEPALRRVIVRRLQTLAPAARIIEAQDGTLALALLHATALDAIVTDHLMPGATGLDVLREVRRMGLTIPVVFVSAHAAIVAQALAEGATRFLDKPFTIAQLDDVLRAVIDNG